MPNVMSLYRMYKLSEKTDFDFMDQFISWSFVQAPRTLPEHLGGDAFPGQFFHQNKNLAMI